MSERSDLTEWFDEDTKPVHIGVYETYFYRCHQGYSLWNGRRWMETRKRVTLAAQEKIIGNQKKCWRGIAAVTR